VAASATPTPSTASPAASPSPATSGPAGSPSPLDVTAGGRARLYSGPAFASAPPTSEPVPVRRIAVWPAGRARPADAALATTAVPPAQADQEIRETLEMFVDGVNVARWTGDTSVVEALMSPACEECAELLSDGDAYEEGARTDALQSLVSVSATSRTPAVTSVRMTLSMPATQYWDAPGEVPYQEPAQTITQLVDLERTTAGWRIAGLLPA
jgi:hypothetical protein